MTELIISNKPIAPPLKAASTIVCSSAAEGAASNQATVSRPQQRQPQQLSSRGMCLSTVVDGKARCGKRMGNGRICLNAFGCRVPHRQ